MLHGMNVGGKKRVGNIGGMLLIGENGSAGRENATQCHAVLYKSHRHWTGIEPGPPQ